jgi:hypothetical protein
MEKLIDHKFDFAVAGEMAKVVNHLIGELALL